jgi:hypothetical protein
VWDEPGSRLWTSLYIREGLPGRAATLDEAAAALEPNLTGLLRSAGRDETVDAAQLRSLLWPLVTLRFALVHNGSSETDRETGRPLAAEHFRTAGLSLLPTGRPTRTPPRRRATVAEAEPAEPRRRIRARSRGRCPLRPRRA